MKFFITGNSSIQDGLDLDFIAPVNCGSGNFASKGQTLPQSYSIAKNIFRLVGKDKIDFVLIGLTPNDLFRVKNDNLTEEILDENLQTFKDYIKFCQNNNAKPVGMILPVAPFVRESYNEKFLKPINDILVELKKVCDFKVINFFEIKIPEEVFSDKNLRRKMLSVILAQKLFELKIFSQRYFYSMSYDYFNVLSYVTDKNSFHKLMKKIFSNALKKLRRKKKIKVAFVTDHAACWCGDKLYNLFAQNERFETTVFFCRSGSGESTLEDARHDIEQFKSAGINAVGVFDLTTETESQDIIFLLRPYISFLSKSFQFNVLTPQTLLIYIPYGIETIPMTYYNIPVFRLAWKIFFDTEFSRRLFDEKCSIGVPRGLVSGHNLNWILFLKTRVKDHSHGK